MARSNHLLNINEVFKAQASSIYDTFATEMGVASFRVPVYQRQYSWDKENIDRLYEDVFEGLRALGSDEDYLTFLGTIVLVDEHTEKEQSFDGHSLSVVDGQQRLTTLALMCCELHSALSNIDCLEGKSDPLSEALTEERKMLSNKLFSCAIGHGFSPGALEVYEYFPRIVRAESDIRSAVRHEAQYESPIADYLFRFCQRVTGTHGSEDDARVFGSDAEGFRERLEIISAWTTDIKDESTGEALFPRTEKLFCAHEYRRVLFPWLQQRTDRIRDVLATVRGGDGDELRPLITLVGFGNYLLQRVAITMVIARDERYAFDIFGSLNSTGEPLTAIETFKPSVIRSEATGRARYEDSPSRHAFDQIEDHVRSIISYEDQQRESAELVVLLSLYVSGERLGLGLSRQRRYLRSVYETRASGIEAKRRFVRALAELAEFRRRFWTKDVGRLSSQIRTAEDKEFGLMCVRLILDMRNSLAIPILCRYWVDSEKVGDESLFVNAAKAIAAFLVLRRGATGGTRGIDSDYRRVMSHGSATALNSTEGLCTGIEAMPAAVPDIPTLCAYLRGYLSLPRVGVSSKEDWLRRVAGSPLYRTAPVALCRFIVLAAAHNAVPDRERGFLLRKGRNNPEKDYMNLSTWGNADYSTIEHIAPQARTRGWSEDIYESPDLVNSLGNLTLLPEKLNSSIGGKPWEKKRLLYKAAAAPTQEEVDEWSDEARRSGLDFGKKTINMLRRGRCLPVLSSVAAAESWDAEVISARTRNIAALVWDQLAPWLDWRTD